MWDPEDLKGINLDIHLVRIKSVQKVVTVCSDPTVR